MENYCEAYHLPFIHPDLNSYSRLEDHYNILDDTSYAGQGSNVYNPQIADDGRQFPSFSKLSSKWDQGAEYCAFFPNVLLGVHHDHAFAIILTPAGPIVPLNALSFTMRQMTSLKRLMTICAL